MSKEGFLGDLELTLLGPYIDKEFKEMVKPVIKSFVDNVYNDDLSALYSNIKNLVGSKYGYNEFKTEDFSNKMVFFSEHIAYGVMIRRMSDAINSAYQERLKGTGPRDKLHDKYVWYGILRGIADVVGEEEIVKKIEKKMESILDQIKKNNN